MSDPIADPAAAATPYGRIVALCMERGIAQSALCLAAGLDRSVLSNAKRNGGRMDAATVEKFAAALGAAPAGLMGWDGPAPAAAGYDAAEGVVALALQQLCPSPVNPRRSFDETALAELAESIAAMGLLQNLVVRPLPGADGYATLPLFEIVAGERRFRALRLLAARGAWNAEAPNVACRIIAADDGEQRALALIENLQREPVAPIEEAEAFRSLMQIDPDTWTTQAIADKIGKTRRFVQLRLALVEKTAPAVQQALRDGSISAEQARVLATAAPAEQPALLDELHRGRYRTADELRRAVHGTGFPAGRALFDRALYTGEARVDDDSGDELLLDVEQCGRLQRDAVKRLRQDLQAQGCPWITVLDAAARGEWFQSYQYRVNPGHPKAGVVIEIAGDHAVNIYRDLVRAADLNEGQARVAARVGDPPKAAADPYTKAHYAHATLRKSWALQAAVAADALAAQRLVIMAMLRAGNRVVTVSRGDAENGANHNRAAPALCHRTLALVRAACPGVVWHADERGVAEKGEYTGSGGTTQAAVWQALQGLDAGAVARLFAHLVALRVGPFIGYEPKPGDDPAAVAVARTLGVAGNEAAHGLFITAEDLDGLRKDALVAEARRAGISGRLDGMKAADLRGLIGEHAGVHVIPTLRFGSEAEIRALLAGTAADEIADEDTGAGIAERVAQVLARRLRLPGAVEAADLDLATSLAADLDADAEDAADIAQALQAEFGLVQLPYKADPADGTGFPELGIDTVGDLVARIRLCLGFDGRLRAERGEGAHPAAADDPLAIPAFLRRTA